MYREPLERYLLHKINELYPHMLEGIHMGRIAADAHGCNWEVTETIPPATAKMAIEIDRNIIGPAREMINLVE
jgi:hypothetical protein